MKISCEIIKDLLPLYADNICSDESKAAIDEHIRTCNSCKTELQSMNISLPINDTEQNLKEAEAVKNLSERWKKGMKKSLLKGALIAALSIGAFILVLYMFFGIQSF